MSFSTIRLAGHLTAPALEAALAVVDFKTGPSLLVDVMDMTGYDPAARDVFVEWNRRHRAEIQGVAVVTTKILWRSVIAAMALAASQRMKSFATSAEAQTWLQSL